MGSTHKERIPTGIEKKVTDLNAGWYNHLCTAMHLDPATFQLVQGSLGLTTSDSYGMPLQALLPEGGLARRVSQLVLVDDYKITVTNNAKCSESEVRRIEAEATPDAWPFVWGLHRPA